MRAYWKPRRYYVEHLLLCIHNHAFIFVLFGLYFSAAALIPVSAVNDILFLLAELYAAYYLYAAMRRVYGQGRIRTLAKLGVLSCSYLVSAGIIAAIVYLYVAIES